MEAMVRLFRERQGVKLLVVGGGPEKERLVAQVDRLGIGDQVVFTGRVPHEQVRRYYDLVTFFVYPRHRMRLTDLVTPLKPLEAMAQGSIVVASDVRSEEHTSELQSLMRISYAVFCLKKKKQTQNTKITTQPRQTIPNI